MSVRAMVLAAGYGTRLKPLTDLLPKPMVPVANRPLIGWCLDRLQAASIGQVAVNLHHLGDLVRAGLGDGRAWGLQIVWSPEPTILGTGGGLVQMRDFLDQDTFVVLNGDVLSAVDLAAVVDFHKRRGAAATMVVRPYPAGAGFTPLQADSSGRLVRFKGVERPARGAARDCMFCGVHVLEPVIFAHLPETGFSCVNDQGYTSLLRTGQEVAAFWYPGPWFDLGTPARYLQASREVLSGRARLPGFESPEQGVLIDPDARIEPGAQLGPELAIGPGCVIEAGARLARAIVWPGTRIAGSERLDAVIAAFDQRVDARRI